jgi:two-component system LytT family response regulator
MNSIKTILVDDEPRGLSSLKQLLELHCPQVQLTGTCSSADEALKKIQELKPQLVFLDIDMPGKNGFDLLHELPEIDFEIIFVTAHSTFMTQAFHFSAIDYLLKPVEEELLVEAVKRAAKRIIEKTGTEPLHAFLHNVQQRGTPQKMKLCIPSLKGFQVVELNEIIYCEASGNYTNFHFTRRPVICASKPIHDYEALLSDSGFIRVHKSFLVNLEHIIEYLRGEGGSVILTNGQEVEVSRRKKDILMMKMKEYYKF